MENKWQVEINREGNLLVHAYSTLDALDNLFGIRQMQSGLCIYAHELHSLRSLLLGMYPDASLSNRSLTNLTNLGERIEGHPTLTDSLTFLSV